MPSAESQQLFHIGPGWLRRLLVNGGLLVILFTITFSLQWASGAHSAAFGSEPDEASHYVTGVMIRDYIVRGLPGNPLKFAEDFYVHYPRVAFGLWPPLFHLLSALWMLVFGTGRISVMVMLAAITTAWAFVLYRGARSEVGTGPAMLIAILLVCLPVTQQSTSTVMLDILLALTMLLAMVAYTCFLKTEKALHAFMFGLCAGLALLVKYNALALVLLPPLCVVITGRYYLLRSRNFWLPVPIVLIVAGPWYVMMRRLILYAAAPGKTSVLGTSFGASAKGMFFVAGPVVFLLGLLACVLVVAKRSPQRELFSRKDKSLYVSAAALVVAVFLFHSVYPLYEPRYSLPAAPALFLLALPAIAFVRSALDQRRTLMPVVLVVILAAHSALTFVIPLKNTSAFVRTADVLFASGLPGYGGLLVSAEAIGEGMVTAEFVMRDNRPDHYVVRATKVLATQNLMGNEYELKYHSAEEIMAVLDSIPIARVVMQRCPPGNCGEHENLLKQAAELYPERWQLRSVIPSENGAPILIYQINGNENKPVQSLQFDMAPTLGKKVEN